MDFFVVLLLLLRLLLLLLLVMITIAMLFIILVFLVFDPHFGLYMQNCFNFVCCLSKAIVWDYIVIVAVGLDLFVASSSRVLLILS